MVGDNSFLKSRVYFQRPTSSPTYQPTRLRRALTIWFKTPLFPTFPLSSTSYTLIFSTFKLQTGGNDN
jgi:hypothetical protein